MQEFFFKLLIIPELLHAGKLQNFYIQDRSRNSKFSNFQEFSCSDPFKNLFILDHVRMSIFWTIPKICGKVVRYINKTPPRI